ncbi:hypothetical protein GCM10020220_071560 [Nonomuraea rubra]
MAAQARTTMVSGERLTPTPVTSAPQAVDASRPGPIRLPAFKADRAKLTVASVRSVQGHVTAAQLSTGSILLCIDNQAKRQPNVMLSSPNKAFR